MGKADGFFTNIPALARLHSLLVTEMLSPFEFTVGSVMCQYMGDKDVCWPTREEISRRTGIRRVATISAAITRLVEIGFISRERTQRGVRYRLRDSDSSVAHDGSPEEALGALSGAAHSATPENPGVAGDATPESGGEESRRSTTRTSGVAGDATPANTLHLKQETKQVCAFSSEGEKSPSAQPVTEAKPVDELASPPTTPPPPSAKKVAKKPTVKTQREQAAERIVDLYRQKVRSRVLDVATPKAHSVKRICEIMQGGVTEEQLTLAVEKCAVHYADKDPQYRVGIRKFFSKGQGDVWRGLLEMPSSEEKTMSACSLDHLDYWRGEFHEKFGFEWGERFEKRARELQSVEQARDELLPLARSEKELCHA